MATSVPDPPVAVPPPEAPAGSTHGKPDGGETREETDTGVTLEQDLVILRQAVQQALAGTMAWIEWQSRLSSYDLVLLEHDKGLAVHRKSTKERLAWMSQVCADGAGLARRFGGAFPAKLHGWTADAAKSNKRTG